MPESPDVIIVGAGVIGLVTAWRAAARGLAVAVLDAGRTGRASQVAAGMLTPVSELTYGEEELLRLGLASLDRYPAFVAELEDLTGQRTGLRLDGTLQVAFDSDDLAYLAELQRFQESLGIAVETLNSRECRRLEPLLVPSVRGGLLAAGDGSVDPRRLTAALRAAAERTGAIILHRRVAGVLVERDQATGVRLDDGTELRSAQVLLAAGAWTSRLDGLPPGLIPPVRPVKGQVVRLRARGPFLGRTVRGVVTGSAVYLVPRPDSGELVLGATQEELGYDTTVTAGGVWELLRDARALVPGISELEFVEVDAGLRPGSPDNAPILGPTALPGLFVATGHFRGGVLLAPVTGEALAEALCTGQVPAVAATFTSGRFVTEVPACR